MTSSELKTEHAHIYSTRLAILNATDPPSAQHHNMAVIEADAHVAAIRRETETESVRRLRELRESL